MTNFRMATEKDYAEAEKFIPMYREVCEKYGMDYCQEGNTTDKEIKGLYINHFRRDFEERNAKSAEEAKEILIGEFERFFAQNK